MLGLSKTIEASSGRAMPLLHAAALYHHHDGHPPETTLYPLITARNGTELTTCAELVHLRLPQLTNANSKP
jgi:hypothetical protein